MPDICSYDGYHRRLPRRDGGGLSRRPLDVVRKVRYDSAFTFIYSKRTGTPAAAMEDQVPEDVALKDRFDRLLKEVQEIARETSSRYTGQVVEVLAEEKNHQEAGHLTGRLSNNLLVHFKGDESLIGKLVSRSADRMPRILLYGRARLRTGFSPFCNCSEPSRFPRKSVNHACMNEHFYAVEIYLADTPHRRNAQHFEGGSEQLRCFNDKKVIITPVDSQKTSVYIL